MKRSDFIRDFMEKAPGPVVDRKAAAGLSGGLICSGALANLDSKGLGVDKADRVFMGRRTGYRTEAFANWLADRMNLQG